MTRPDLDATAFTIPFGEITSADLPRVGGKGANLGTLTRAGIPVPRGFCVTTTAYEVFMGALPDADGRFAALDALDGTGVEEARAAATAMRDALDNLPLPEPVRVAVVAAWQTLNGGAVGAGGHPLAVRSSATAEDLPGASFAGQQDTYLNIRGGPALLDAVKRCWISLFTDRAVLYRARGGFGHRAIKLSVVVQHLVEPDVSGILFTADPVSGHRQIVSIDAGFGLGEALVSGLISADLYQVDRRRMTVLLARTGNKAFAIRSLPGGGTRQEPLSTAQQTARCLNDAQILELAAIGGKVENLYGGVPQDIEWCIRGGHVYVVQARPITSLFPIPRQRSVRSDEDAGQSAPTDGDRGLRIYLSFGHFQMMLDAMPRLALEVWRLFFPAGKGGLPTLHDPPRLSATMVPVASRLFIDATPALRVRRARSLFIGMMTVLYEALARSTAALVKRPEFAEGPADAPGVALAALRALGPVVAGVPGALLWRDPASGAARFNDALDELPRQARMRILAAGTPAARIRQSAIELSVVFREVRRHLPRLLGGVIAHRLLIRMARGSWADTVRSDVELLLRGLPGNVTTQMDLAVGDLSDLVRPYPALAEMLRTTALPWTELRSALTAIEGGPAFIAALDAFLEQYGDRGASEVDLSRPRWRDDPSLLLKVITGGQSAGEAGAHRRQHQAQVAAAEEAAARLVAAADGHGPVGLLRRWLVARLARVARVGLGLREHPKFIIVRLLGVVRAQVLAAGEALAARGQLARVNQVWHLGFEELARALGDPALDLRGEVTARQDEWRLDQKRRVPIVISSDGETPTLAMDRADLPAGALVGTAASNGVVEGIARVVIDPAREVIHAGEILVAPFTDPGWTPLFVHAAGLVTEVGGMMTHGAVVAREYGIPAVVSVDAAVARIKTGQRIRVDGTRGFVQILEQAPTA